MNGPNAPIGLIAGRGALPIEVAREIRRQGRQVICVDIFDGDPGLPAAADAYYAVALGNVGGILEAFRRHGVREVLLAGKVDKLPAVRRAQLDAEGARFAGAVRDHRDTSIMNAFLALLERSGFEIGNQTRYLADCLPSPGSLGQRPPSDAEAGDLRVGLAIAARLAALDIGQAVAVRHGTVVAVEAAEGTDAMIRRAGALTPGIVVAKVSRPQQDLRYDLPVVGPETVRALAEARGTALGVEAGRTILLERGRIIADAAAAGIAVIAAAAEA
ncbi:MAG TPA: UDP-2,3-diacylglucosamine diphosphatase LpxI [bacterium]|nr:UDP-2,3-diacylglucosamine diphosphatase LpxI [bacterium]